MADPSTAPPLTPSSVAEAHAKIKPYVHYTPLITSKTLNQIASHPKPSLFLATNPPPLTSATTNNSSPHPPPKFNIYFKCENDQKIGAFKARGAHHALIRLISEHGLPYLQSRGVVTHSSGNHAQALALAAHNFNVPSYIVMPSISTPSKIAGTRMYTDNIVLSHPTFDDREARVAEIVERTGAILVPPFDHPDIILGAGTAAFEMEQQFREMKQREREHEQSTTNSTEPTPIPAPTTNHDQPNSDSQPHFDAVLAPLGGGGLLCGTATWFSHTSPSPSNTNMNTNTKQTLIFGCEPSFSGANDAELGLSTDPPTRIPHVSSLTIADGLRTPVGLLNWSIISDTSKVTAVYSATEAQIKDAMRLVMERVKVWVEPSAVVPVAVVLFNERFREMVAERQAEEGSGRAWDVGIVLSGGNTTVEAVARLFGTQGEGSGERQTAQVGVSGERKAEDVAG